MTTHIHHRSHAQPATLVAASAVPKRSGFNGTQGLSAMLLAAMVSAVWVVAYQLIDAWVHGHLMVAWVALWLVGFAAIALFSDAAHKLAGAVVSRLDAALSR